MIQALRRILDKPERCCIGLMSGTSMDGIDAALVHIEGSGKQTRVRLEAFACYPYEKDLVDRLQPISGGAPATALDWARLDHHIAQSFARACVALLDANNIPAEDIDFIASHGQTLAHHAGFAALDPMATTWQAGNGNVIAALTGIPVLSDFRSADVALGGTGAPLVPYVDYLLHHSQQEDRIVLNVGGIANLTWLPASGRLADTRAWDTGPGNMVLDGLSRALLGQPHDVDGRVAAQGKVHEDWLQEMLQNEWLATQPPKAAGREQFGEVFLQAFRAQAQQRQASVEDQLATALELTVQAIACSLQWLPVRNDTVLYVTGGGRHNTTLMRRLEATLACSVQGLEVLGVRIDAKEAVDFAVLGNEALHGRCANLTQVTGALRPLILGSLALAGFTPLSSTSPEEGA